MIDLRTSGSNSLYIIYIFILVAIYSNHYIYIEKDLFETFYKWGSSGPIKYLLTQPEKNPGIEPYKLFNTLSRWF